MLEGDYVFHTFSIYISSRQHYNNTCNHLLHYHFFRNCPANYVCVKGAGPNPKYGYIGYDDFLLAMLTTLQVCTLDYWESVYNSVRILTNIQLP